jgi:hypothetical protein
MDIEEEIMGGYIGGVLMKERYNRNDVERD